MTIRKSAILLFLIILFGSFLRLYNTNWDNGYYLHPDERLYVNASNITMPLTIKDFFSPSSSLNPHMFYYGSFPLYLYKTISTFLLPLWDFLLVSRWVSAVLSAITIPIIYFIGKRLFSSSIGLLAACTFTFAPGSIQNAHFNTTESTLIFLLSCILLFSILLTKRKGYLISVIIGVLLGLSYGTKIIGITFSIIPFTALILQWIQIRKWPTIVLSLLYVAIFSIIVGFIVAPYQIIDFSNFFREQSYMQSVIRGTHKPPFVIIYEQTTPYLYQLVFVFPFILGFLTYLLGLIGIVSIVKNYKKSLKKNFPILLILIFPLLYFIGSGIWYAKFARYYLLLLPFFCLYAGYILSKIPKAYSFLLILIICVNGIMMLNIYTKPHTRIAASHWIYNNIPQNKILYGEHWDDPLPLPLPNHPSSTYQLKQLTVYEPDSKEKLSKLYADITEADYIIFSSRRVYYSILQNPTIYPHTSNFYKQLFSGKIGYTLVKKFTNYPFILSDDVADESFQSYDHPPVLIFKNEKKHPKELIESLVLKEN